MLTNGALLYSVIEQQAYNEAEHFLSMLQSRLNVKMFMLKNKLCIKSSRIWCQFAFYFKADSSVHRTLVAHLKPEVRFSHNITKPRILLRLISLHQTNRFQTQIKQKCLLTLQVLTFDSVSFTLIQLVFTNVQPKQKYQHIMSDNAELSPLRCDKRDG